MAMIRSRNQTAHAYNEQVAAEIARQVIDYYHPLFQAFRARMEDLEARQ